jgi:hypothetical protein
MTVQTSILFFSADNFAQSGEFVKIFGGESNKKEDV